MSDGRATRSRRTFRLEHAVAIDVRAVPEKIWSLLTDSAAFPSWNSTVTRMTGQIALGEKVALQVPAAPNRTFKVKVAVFEPPRRMVWVSGAAPMFHGVRTYTLTPRGGGLTEFSMVEVFAGLMLPVIAGSLPDFGPSFEQYAADLKRAAEKA